MIFTFMQHPLLLLGLLCLLAVLEHLLVVHVLLLLLQVHLLVVCHDPLLLLSARNTRAAFFFWRIESIWQVSALVYRAALRACQRSSISRLAQVSALVYLLYKTTIEEITFQNFYLELPWAHARL